MLANNFFSATTETMGETLLSFVQDLQVELSGQPYCPETTDMDSMKYDLDRWLPAFFRRDLDTIVVLSFAGEILIGLGLGSMLLASWFRCLSSASSPLGGNNLYAGALEFQAVLFGMAAALFGFITFIDYLNYPTAFNALRAWKWNYLTFGIVFVSMGLPISSAMMDI